MGFIDAGFDYNTAPPVHCKCKIAAGLTFEFWWIVEDKQGLTSSGYWSTAKLQPEHSFLLL